MFIDTFSGWTETFSTKSETTYMTEKKKKKDGVAVVSQVSETLSNILRMD